jgi:hypothetical protein
VPLIAHEVHLALRLPCTPSAVASTASNPASVTIAIRPSVGWTMMDIKVISVWGKEFISDNQNLSA